MEDDMIQVESLFFRYGKKEDLFEDLSCSLTSGTIYGLLGKNGAGKTTLLKLLAGTLYPLSGAIDILGYNPRNRKPGMLREIFFITEEFVLPPVKGGEYVSLNAPFYPRFNQEIFREYLDEFDLKEKDLLTSLSYGQKKKFLLAFGLATNSKIFFLDEPTNGLDIPSKSQFRKLIAASITEERTFIISTHQVRDMENLIDPIIILDSGKIIFQETMGEVMNKLSLNQYAEEPSWEGVVHWEKAMGRYITLEENSTGQESQIDLELLFSTVVGNREKISKIFHKEVVQ
jgi:ABC-2 type transport system ATP-binding protein